MVASVRRAIGRLHAAASCFKAVFNACLIKGLCGPK